MRCSFLSSQGCCPSGWDLGRLEEDAWDSFVDLWDTWIAGEMQVKSKGSKVRQMWVRT